jgi:hypothetical protein
MPHDNRHGHALKLHRSSGFGEVSIHGTEPKTPDDTGLRQIGTLIAISNSALGVAANFVIEPGGSERAHWERCSERTAGEQQRQRRGGARNRADRVSFGLTPSQVANLRAAAAHAELIGLPFNRMTTVHWEAAGVPLEAMARATGRFTDLFSKALTRHSSRTAWAWVHESGDGMGGHCHLLAHVPPALATIVSRRQRSWLRRITGRPYRPRAILTKPIGGLLGLESGNPDLHAVNLTAALNYLTKGIDPKAADGCNIVRLEPGGRVIGKRCGMSQNIGPKARKECDASTTERRQAAKR